MTDQNFFSQPSLPKLLLINMFDKLQHIFSTPYSRSLPKRVNEFVLQKELEKIGTAHAYHLAKYKTAGGEYAFAKMWIGRYKNFSYFSLKNELQMYVLLTKTQKRLKKTMPDRFKKCYIPELLEWKESGNSLIMFTEYVEGKIANDTTTDGKLKAYWLLTDYISFLGENMTNEEKSQIPHRGFWSFVFLYPLLVVAVCFAHPELIGLILQGIPVFARSLSTLAGNSNQTLIHRDLHFKNILVERTRYTLIDLQLCARTYKLYEYVTTLRYRWGEDDLHQKLLTEVREKLQTSPDFRSMFKGLGVFSATHGLTGTHFPKQKIEFWKNFLQFSINA
jgi:hypothetical protein